MSIRSLVLDAYDMLDVGAITSEEFQKVAELNLESATDRESIYRQLDRDFALVFVLPNGDRLRKFPVNNKTNTMMSQRAFLANRGKLPERAQEMIAHRLVSACGRYGIEADDEVAAIMRGSLEANNNYYYVEPELLAIFGSNIDSNESDDFEEEAPNDATTKEASTRTLWGIDDTIGEQKFRKYPMKTAEQVRKLVRNFGNIGPRMMCKYAFQLADNVVKRAKELKVTIPEESVILKYASTKLSPYFSYAISDRLKIAARDPQMFSSYMDLLSKKASYTPRQIASALEGLDQSYRLRHRYGIEFPNPVDSVLGISKLGEDLSTGDTMIDPTSLRQALEDNREAFEEHLDSEIVDKLEKDPDALKTLPIPVRQLVSKILYSVS